MMHLGMDYNAVQAVSEYQFFGLVNSWLMGANGIIIYGQNTFITHCLVHKYPEDNPLGRLYFMAT